MEADWDLHAVVRGFASITSTSHDVARNIDTKEQEEAQKKRDGFCSKSLTEELHELFLSYLLNPSQTRTVPSVQPTISSYLAALEVSKFKQHRQATTTTVAADAPHSQPRQKPKRRKFQMKKISHVRAEALSSDVWAWRKYGQKPIKGSPYPRGYYKCSSSKACFARKQVERNRSDPTLYIVTCTGEHNHPAPTHKNSLAGTTRNPQPTFTAAQEETFRPTSKHSSCSSLENMTPLGSADDEVSRHSIGMEDDINRNDLVSDMLEFLNMDDVTDDFFDGLGEIDITPVKSFCFTDPFQLSFMK